MKKTLDQKIEEAKRLRASGMGYKAIGNLLTCSYALAYYYVNHSKGSSPKQTSGKKTQKVNALSAVEVEKHSQTRIVNLCPHAIWINGKQHNSEGCVRVNKGRVRMEDVVPGVMTYKTYFEKLDLQIPPKQYGVIYVVSSMTAGAYPERDDIYTITTENPSPGVDIDGLMFNPYYK